VPTLESVPQAAPLHPAPDTVQVTLLVRFCVLLSEKVPVAVNCCAFPAATDGFFGVTAIDTSFGSGEFWLPEPEAQPSKKMASPPSARNKPKMERGRRDKEYIEQQFSSSRTGEDDPL